MPGLFEYLDRFKILLGGGLPKTLSDAGNLKVSIEEQQPSASNAVDLEQVLGVALSDSNPVIAREATTSTTTSPAWGEGTSVGFQVMLSLTADGITGPYGLVAVMLQAGGGAFTSGSVRFLAGSTQYGPIFGVTPDLSVTSSYAVSSIPANSQVTLLFPTAGVLGSFIVILSDKLVGPGVGLTVNIVAMALGGPSIPTVAKVVSTPQSYTEGSLNGLTQTTEGRLRVDLEATSRDVGGVTVVDTADRQLRRLQEQLVLEAYEQSIRNLFLADSETSHRMGFEVR